MKTLSKGTFNVQRSGFDVGNLEPRTSNRSTPTSWIVSSLILLAAVMTLSALAFGAETAPAATSPVQDVLTSIMQLGALVLAGMVAWAVKLLAAKFKLSISDQQQELIRKAARDAVFYAEEYAAKKFNASGVAADGAEKLLQATAFVIGKVPGADSAEVQGAIHAVLGSIQGLGASKPVGSKQ